MFVATSYRASLLAMFSQQHLLTLCLWSHSGSSHSIPHFSCYHVCRGDLWSAVFDVTAVAALGRHDPNPQQTKDLVRKGCVFSDGSSLTRNTEIRPVHKPTTASQCSGARKSRTSLTVSQKLGTMKLDGEAMLKARPPNSQVVEAKGKFLKQIKSEPTDKKAEQPYC